MKIQIPKTFLEEEVEGAMGRALKKQNTNPVTPKQNTAFGNSDGFWTIEGVSYRGQTHTVDLLKTLLDNGANKTQDEWVEYTKTQKQNNGFYTGDFPLYNSLFTALYERRNEKIAEEIREFLKEQFKKNWLTTLTRIKYMPKGLDEIIHNYNLPDQYIINETIIGPDGYLKNAETNAQPALNAVLGSKKTDEIDEIYKWITGKDTYIWRLNNKPKKIEERVARFSANSVRAYLNCNRNPSGSYSSLGVRAAKSP